MIDFFLTLCHFWFFFTLLFFFFPQLKRLLPEYSPQLNTFEVQSKRLRAGRCNRLKLNLMETTEPNTPPNVEDDTQARDVVETVNEEEEEADDDEITEINVEKSINSTEVKRDKAGRVVNNALGLDSAITDAIRKSQKNKDRLEAALAKELSKKKSNI